MFTPVYNTEMQSNHCGKWKCSVLNQHWLQSQCNRRMLRYFNFGSVNECKITYSDSKKNLDTSFLEWMLLHSLTKY